LEQEIQAVTDMVVYRHFVEPEDREDRGKQVDHSQLAEEVMVGMVVAVAVVEHPYQDLELEEQVVKVGMV